MPLLAFKVTVNEVLSRSATVKSTKPAPVLVLTPVVTGVATVGTPLIVGASFTAATLIATGTAAAELRPPLSMA